MSHKDRSLERPANRDVRSLALDLGADYWRMLEHIAIDNDMALSQLVGGLLRERIDEILDEAVAIQAVRAFERLHKRPERN